MFAEIGGFMQGAGALAGALGLGKGSSTKDARKMIDMQNKAFRVNLPMNVQAFKDAGIHPLYGMNSMQFQPQAVSVGSEPSIGERLHMAGQGISAAASAYTTKEERALAQVRDNLSLRRMELENKLLESQITSINAPRTPALPSAVSSPAIAGQGDAYGMDVNPLQANASRVGRPHVEAGAINEVAFARTRNGWVPVMSDDVKQRLEEDTLGTIGWSVRNRLPQFLSAGAFGERPFKAPDGKYWSYSPFSGEWILKDNWLKKGGN